MKRLLLTLVVTLAFCGSMFAQDNYYTPVKKQYYDCFNAFAQINSEYVTESFDYSNLEIAAFVGEECRAAAFMDFWPDWGDPYPMIDLMIQRNLDETGSVVTFKMYDHATGTEYLICSPNMDIILGDDHLEINWGYYDEAVVLNFINAQEFTKTIECHHGEEGHFYILATPVPGLHPTEVTNMIADELGVEATPETAMYDLYSFEQTAELEWLNYRGSEDSFTLAAGQGYLYANKGEETQETVTLTFTGMPYNGDGEFDLIYNEGFDFSGWNLVGNPFGETAYIDGEYYVMDDARANVIAATNTSLGIPAMEGCFVKATGANQTVKFLQEAPAVHKKTLALNLGYGRGIIDRAIVRIGEGQALPKFQLNRNSSKLYMPVDGNDYAVVYAENAGEMPVSFKASKNGLYSIVLDIENVEFNYLHLIDNMTGNDVDLLSTPSYSFEARTTDYANRFRLVFATGNADENFAFMNNGNLIINNEGNATLQVIDVTGRIINSESINGSCSVALNAVPGVYMIRLINGSNVKTQKMVVE